MYMNAIAPTAQIDSSAVALATALPLPLVAMLAALAAAAAQPPAVSQTAWH